MASLFDWRLVEHVQRIGPVVATPLVKSVANMTPDGGNTLNTGALERRIPDAITHGAASQFRELLGEAIKNGSAAAQVAAIRTSYGNEQGAGNFFIEHQSDYSGIGEFCTSLPYTAQRLVALVALASVRKFKWDQTAFNATAAIVEQSAPAFRAIKEEVARLIVLSILNGSYCAQLARQLPACYLAPKEYTIGYGYTKTGLPMSDQDIKDTVRVILARGNSL